MRWIVLLILLAAGLCCFIRGPTIRAKPIDVYAKWGLEAIPSRVEYHIVQRGETLNDIAALYEIGSREMTEDMIRELNSLWGFEPRPGQALKVPEPDKNEWPIGMSWCWEEGSNNGL